jgi:hypothetical protein
MQKSYEVNQPSLDREEREYWFLYLHLHWNSSHTYTHTHPKLHSKSANSKIKMVSKNPGDEGPKDLHEI